MSNTEETYLSNRKINNKSSDFNTTKGGKLRLKILIKTRMHI